MAIKDIVLHQGPDSRSPARLNIAVALAKAHDARVIGDYTAGHERAKAATAD
jgi:hypothetical protein